jgi:hypothetical protein
VLQRLPTEGFGFSVRGDSPVTVADIEIDSVAGVRASYYFIYLFICWLVGQMHIESGII